MVAFTHHPARERPIGTIAVVGVLALIAWATFTSLADRGMTVLMMLIYVAYMASFLFPSQYRIDDDGITLVRLGVKHVFLWSRFRRFSRHPGGIFLAPLGAGHVIDSVRGVYLVMDKSQQALLVPYLEAHVAVRQQTV